MLSWYAERIARQLRSAECRGLLSLGVGFQIVCRRLFQEFDRSLRRYVVLEGSQALVHRVREMLRHDGLELVHTLFEEFETDERFDAIEMGFVLEHVEDPAALLERYVRLLEPNGRMFVAVPNARSLHRRVGQAAGLLDNPYRLSEHDLQLGHRRYYDLQSLSAAVLEAGLKIVNVEGIFLKPVTTGQLEQLALSDEVVRGFYEVGVAYPDLCNAILIETRR